MFLLKKIFVIIFLCILLIYVTNITGIPKSIILFEGETLNLDTVFGVLKSKEKIIETSSNMDESNVINKEKVQISFLNLFNIKNVDITVIKKAQVIPLRKYYRTKTIC